MSESATRDTRAEAGARELPPPDFHDPVIEAYKKDVDRTLLRENLKLTVTQRILKAQSFHRSVEAIRGIAWKQPVARGTEKHP